MLASATFESEGEAKRPSVQVGDPFAEKVLIECCLEIFAADLVVGIQDLGAAGLSCATTELAAAGTGGMDVDLDLVPLRDPTLAPEEILMSESQERMMAVVTPDAARAVPRRLRQVGRHWPPSSATVTDTGRLRMHWHGETIVDLPPRTAAHDGPVYRAADRATRPTRTRSRPHDGRSLPRPRSGDELRATAAAAGRLAEPRRPVAGSPTSTTGSCRATRCWPIRRTPGVRLDDSTARGIAVSTDGNGRYTRLDPYAGAQLALAEAYRNVACTGARPLAVTNCLNFGSPEDPAVMWQFAEAVRGLADGCQTLGTPVTGGNVSFYNQTGTVADPARPRSSASSA